MKQYDFGIFVGVTDSSKSKVLKKRKSRWGNDKAEMPAVATLPVMNMAGTSGVGVPGVATNIQLGQGAVVRPTMPGKS